VCSDINGDLIDLWNTVKRDPDGLFDEYTRMWTEMNSLEDRQDKKRYFEMVREEFNQTRSPYCFFFLMRTCTNGIPRYNRYGNFNNTFHITRNGIKPKRLKKIIKSWSELLNEHNVIFKRCDYKMMLDSVDLDDFVYLDPPYEMTRSTGKYFGNVDYLDMFSRLAMLNDRGIKFALSYDSTNEDIIVPGDSYDNHIDIVSKNAGYRKTLLKMDNRDVYESLYVN
jgi:DNA adenine methylase